MAFLYILLDEEILIKLEELDKLDKITHALIAFSYSLTQAQKTL